MFPELERQSNNKCNVEIKLNEEGIKQITVNESIKTSGVHANPQIEWNNQCEHVKNKMQVIVRKLMRIEMKVHHTHVFFFNLHVLTNVFIEVE